MINQMKREAVNTWIDISSYKPNKDDEVFLDNGERYWVVHFKHGWQTLTIPDIRNYLKRELLYCQESNGVLTKMKYKP